MSARKLCSRPWCDAPVVARRLCRRHYQQAWKRGDFDNAPAAPRVPGRTICPPEHKHAGSSTCYIQHQCRCVPCKDAQAEMARRRRKLKAFGRFDSGLVDAEPIRDHMMVLAEFGIGYKRVATLAGISVTAARTILWGRQEPGPRNGELQKRVKRETAEALLAVKPDLANLAGGVSIPARGTHRRMQALVTLGWSISELGRRIGMAPENVHKMMRAETVTVRTHRAVEALFEEMWDVPAPAGSHRERLVAARAVNYAKARRWLPPLAWDDIDNDVEPPVPEPDGELIDEMAVELACLGERVRLTSDERREVVRRLNAAKLSDPEIAARARMSDRTVLRIRQELGLRAAVGADGRAVA